MLRSYLIVGMEDTKIQRTIINRAKSKLQAMQYFLSIYPNTLIMSVCRLDPQEAEFVAQHNMPDSEVLDV